MRLSEVRARCMVLILALTATSPSVAQSKLPISKVLAEAYAGQSLIALCRAFGTSDPYRGVVQAFESRIARQWPDQAGTVFAKAEGLAAKVANRFLRSRPEFGGRDPEKQSEEVVIEGRSGPMTVVKEKVITPGDPAKERACRTFSAESAAASDAQYWVLTNTFYDYGPE